jgi:hypothetical protein
VSPVRRALLVGTAAALGSAAAYRLLGSLPTRVRRPWERTNHAGRAVTLLEGPAYAVGAAAAASAVGSAPVVAALGAAGFGMLDDLAGDSSSKGLRGHLRALRRGQVTTGAVKIGGLLATGVLAAALQQRSQNAPSHSSMDTGVVDLVVRAGLVAGSANVVNLFDLRPGRALKVTLLASAPLLARPGRSGALTAAVSGGAACGVLRADLAGEAMLGDTGANAAGALVGLALAERLRPQSRLVALAALTALTLASERVSFTKVIESTPVLREIDAWGRRRSGAHAR